MKRIILGLGLLVAVFVVSYLKVSYGNGDSEAKVEALVAKQHRADSALAATVSDSLHQLLAEMEAKLATTISSKKEVVGNLADSLEFIIAEQEARIKELTSRASKADKTIADLLSKPSLQGKPGLNHLEVISYYKRRYEKLPSDLSDYERRIMVDELRDETARRYSLTSTQLDKLRKDYQVEF